MFYFYIFTFYCTFLSLFLKQNVPSDVIRVVYQNQLLFSSVILEYIIRWNGNPLANPLIIPYD